jgi:hypothetical protein
VVQEREAEPALAVVAVADCAAEHAVPPAVGDAALLLDVDVHQLARPLDLVADRLGFAHRQACGRIHVAQQRHPEPA